MSLHLTFIFLFVEWKVSYQKLTFASSVFFFLNEHFPGPDVDDKHSGFTLDSMSAHIMMLLGSSYFLVLSR